jgi:CubicO group peptidase (beta-lactamase class C family)
MRRLGWLLSVALLLCVGFRSDGVARPATANTSRDTGRATSSDRALRGLVDADLPGCSAAVGVEGTVVWAGARGVADMSTGAGLSADTVFDIGSVSKQFTAAAVLLLAIDRRLSTQDTVSQYLSGLPGWARQVRIIDLIHHTSGIPDYGEVLLRQGHWYSERTTQAQAVQALAGTPTLRFEPGTTYEYSNSNYLLLAEIVHGVTGSPLPRFLHERIFGPLDLHMVMDPTAKIRGKAISYAYATDGSGLQVADSPWEQVGDGGIMSTPSDLVRWADNYRTGTIGGKALLDAQLADRAYADGFDYGAGMGVTGDGSLVHGGSWAGFHTRFEVTPNRSTAFAVSCNREDQRWVAVKLTAQLRTIWA